MVLHLSSFSLKLLKTGSLLLLCKELTLLTYDLLFVLFNFLLDYFQVLLELLYRFLLRCFGLLRNSCLRLCQWFCSHYFLDVFVRFNVRNRRLSFHRFSLRLLSLNSFVSHFRDLSVSLILHLCRVESLSCLWFGWLLLLLCSENFFPLSYVFNFFLNKAAVFFVLVQKR